MNLKSLHSYFVIFYWIYENTVLEEQNSRVTRVLPNPKLTVPDCIVQFPTHYYPRSLQTSTNAVSACLHATQASSAPTPSEASLALVLEARQRSAASA